MGSGEVVEVDSLERMQITDKARLEAIWGRMSELHSGGGEEVPVSGEEKVVLDYEGVVLVFSGMAALRESKVFEKIWDSKNFKYTLRLEHPNYGKGSVLNINYETLGSGSSPWGIFLVYMSENSGVIFGETINCHDKEIFPNECTGLIGEDSQLVVLVDFSMRGDQGVGLRGFTMPKQG